MRSTLSIVYAFFLFSLASPIWAEGTETASATPAPVLAAITVSTVETRTLRDVVLASGLVAPVEEVQVAPLIEGQPIEALLADVGDKVVQGQVLARLSSTTLELQKTELAASLASAKAQIAQAEAQLIETQSSADEAQRVATRTAALRKQGSASQAAADQAQSGAVSAMARVMVSKQTLEAAKAQLTLAEAQGANVALQLSRTEVKAPVAGEITARNAQLGAVASASGQPMFTLVRDNALELRADVSEGDLARLQLGQTAVLKIAGSNAAMKGTVRLVEPTIDNVTRMGRARIAIDDASQIRSGMFVDAEVLVIEHTAAVVPVSALSSDPDGVTVMKVTDGQVARVIVTTGIRDGGWVEIITGLALGDTVVMKAGAFVRQGDKINPVPFTAETN